MPKDSKKKERPAARVSFYKALQTGPKQLSHQYVHYSIPSNPSEKFSATSSTVQTTDNERTLLPHSNSPENIDGHPDYGNGDHGATDIPVDEEYLKYVAEDPKKRTRGKGDESLQDFIPQMDVFLEEFIGLDGRGCWPQTQCSRCQVGDAEYECLDCVGRELLCAHCMITSHARLYLHRIQIWNGTYFERSLLKRLGLRIQLGHAPGDICISPEQCREGDFTILDTHGIHDVNIDFCGCGRADQRHTIQLMRARLFPATVKNPKTAATFRALDFFALLSYEGKTTAFEIFQTISRATDNTGTEQCKDRYHSLLRMLHEWRHLKMLKRAGRGHDPAGIEATQEGECAVLCPACPQPRINMRPNWKTDGSPRYLHQLFVSIDANFRLKRKNVSSNAADPGLSRGYAYFVEETKYKTHLARFVDEKEPKSTCSRHDAVNLSEKPGQGHAATGIVAVVCSRHDMKRASGVGDLQRGERYCNVDYVVHSSMHKDKEVEYVTYSYDIICQWAIYFRERMEQFDPKFFVFDGKTYVRYLVPKFHLPAHIAKCRSNFSFNFTRETRRTDGEAPERGWVNINGLATSTREMGPGTRRDTIDYHIGDENWKKVNGMGTTLYRKMHAAAMDMAEHVIAHEEFTATLAADAVAKWTQEVEDWDSIKHSKTGDVYNPYEVTASGPSQTSVRHQLAEDEAKDLAAGKDMSLDDKVTASVLIATGMDLEAEQRALKESAKKIWEHSQDRQRTKLLLRTTALQRKIDAWTHYQRLYIPGISKLHEPSSAPSATSTKAYDQSLWLPSQIRNQARVDMHLQRIEFKLRLAQAYEAVDTLQTQLQLRAHLFKFKDRFVRGQGANTRARNTINGVQMRINQAAEQYRVAYAALEVLGPFIFEFGWKKDLLPLDDNDIRDLSEGRATNKKKKGQEKESEGTRTISWIWRKVAIEDESNNEFLADRLRSEWCKSAARADRFKEEVALLTEEMMRVLRYFEWKELEWLKKARLEGWPAGMSEMRKEGLRAYAYRQAGMYRQMRTHFQKLWGPLPAHVLRMQEIIANPDLAEDGEFDSTKASSSRRIHKL